MTEFDRGWNAAMEFIAKWIYSGRRVPNTDPQTEMALNILCEEIAIIARDQIKEPK